MKKNLFRGALSAFLLGTCILNAFVPCLAEGSYSASGVPQMPQRQQAKPMIRQTQVSSASLLPFSAEDAGIRNMDGLLIGWMKNNYYIYLYPKTLPEIQADPSVTPRFSWLDKSLVLEMDGSITRHIGRKEFKQIAKANPEKAKRMSSGAISVAKVDKSGQITDLTGKKIAYFEVGQPAYNASSFLTAFQSIPYQPSRICGIIEANGDVHDIYNRLAGRLDRVDENTLEHAAGRLATSAYKLIKKYEKQHPWPPVSHTDMRYISKK